jgi:hypothetical protein
VCPILAAKPDTRCDLSADKPSENDAHCARRWFDDHLRLNDLVVVGAHNSYKQRIPAGELAIIALAEADAAKRLDYGHPALTALLNAGARELELDVYYDPQGGRFLTPLVPRLANADMGETWRAAMSRPGFKVLHMADVDVRSSCITFRACLAEIRAWSDAHPEHVPILILVNAKDANRIPGGAKPLPFDAAAFDALDAEVHAELAGKLITPDRVQGDYPTLLEAVLRNNWPKLGEARGQILLALEENPAKVAIYRGNRKSLEGRVMFATMPDESSPAAAFVSITDPVKQAERIRRNVARGFLVRTQADADTRQARANSSARRDAALAGGAQYVATDYLWPDPRLPGGYRVNLPHAAAVCNPVRMGRRCGGVPVELQTPIGPADDRDTIMANAIGPKALVVPFLAALVMLAILSLFGRRSMRNG